MMKKLIVGLILVGGVWGQANNVPNQIVLGASGPGGVGSISLTVVGVQGSVTSYYWVVPNFPIGMGQISQQAMLINAPGVLSASNYVRVNWAPVAGATGYWVLKTSTPSQPGTCTCALSGPSNITSYNDQGGGVSGFSYAPVGATTAHITLDNQGYSYPVLTIDTPYNSTLFANLPSATVSIGLIYLIKDALTASTCNAGGGSNTPALCWSNGATWIAIGGGGGGFPCTSPGAGSITCTGDIIANSITLTGGGQDLHNRTVTITDVAPVVGDDGLITVLDSSLAVHLNRISCGVSGSTSVVVNLVKGGASLIADMTATVGDINTVIVTTWANGSSQCGGIGSCAVATHTPVTLHIGTIVGTPTALNCAIDYTVD